MSSIVKLYFKAFDYKIGNKILYAESESFRSLTHFVDCVSSFVCYVGITNTVSTGFPRAFLTS